MSRDDSVRIHPLAKNLWYQLHGRSQADRAFVHNALQRRLSQSTQLASQEIAIAALQRFASERSLASASPAEEERPGWAEGGPSTRRYNAFRSAQSDGHLPSSTQISHAFGGGWGRALAAAGLAPAPNVLASRGLNLGKAFDADEVRAVLRAWIDEVDRDDPDGPLVQAQFAAWTSRKRTSSDTDGMRYPTLPTVFKHLGTWGTVLIELGQLDRHPAVVAARRTIECDQRAGWAIETAQGLDLETLPASGVDDLEHAVGWLRWMTKSLSGEARTALGMSQWAVLRAALIDRLASLGRYAEIPSAYAIASAADDRSWPTAKARAGIVEDACEARCSPTTSAFADEELLDELAAARSALGHPPRRSEYDAYRRSEIRSRRLPSEGTIRMRLGEGNWARALERLAADRPEPRSEGEQR